ncbi:MAG: hypothetical protein ACE14L_00010 [Terriglobales bacterium]
MRPRVRGVASLCFAVLLLANVSSAGEAQVNPEDVLLSNRVPHFALVNETLLDGLKKLSSHDRPFHFGFESVLKAKFSDTSVPEVRFNIQLENKTVREILDALCSADHRYAWSVDDSFVNVYPRASTADPKYLLNRKLPKLEVRNITDIDQALLAIARQLPPPLEQIAHAQMGGDASYPAQPWTATFENITVREAINRLTAHMGPRACWIFYGSLDFRAFAFFKWGFRGSSPNARQAL